MLLREYLQKQHGISRRDIIDYINQGIIFLNNQKVENYKAEVKEHDFLKVGKFISESISFNKCALYPEILLFNKPIGYTCSKDDSFNKTIYELLPKEFKNKYYYIGRLDKNSHGLMLLTTNSKLVHEYEHPSKEIEKSYIVSLNKNFEWNLKEKILGGIREGGELLRTKGLKKGKNGTLIIILNEGKKRHIRRIFKSLGYVVLDLQRISIGKYKLGNLNEGAYVTTQ